ncbi:MAG TPA: hypothetical protein VF503_14225 [Sphingobium sp.]|uniref:hypothetical protein n=1 Tax=Sphingobium sp. TaxID=1912891 RepID=UPI002ED54C88
MNDLSAIIWKGCDPLISDAIHRVVEGWKGYSNDLNAKRSIIVLIKKFMDPAIVEFRTKLPIDYQYDFLGGGFSNYSDFLIRYGYDESRIILKKFEKDFSQFNYREKYYHESMSTLSSIYSFTLECEIKRSKKSRVRDKEGLEGGLNQNRDHVYCIICGNRTAFASLVAQKSDPQGASGKCRPSYKFCSEHTPVSNGKCNSIHKRGMRNLDYINKECFRILKACFLRKHVKLSDFTSLIDFYFSHYIEKHQIEDIYISKVRRHAYEMVRDGISDNKKGIMALKKIGHSQLAIAEGLGIRRQSVSKALISVPEKFRI